MKVGTEYSMAKLPPRGPAMATSCESGAASKSMLLSAAISADLACTHPNGFATVFGDSYLYQNNHILRTVRGKAVNLGIEFLPADVKYLASPIHHLRALFSGAPIRLIPTSSMAILMESRRPNFFYTADFDVMTSMPSAVAYETAWSTAIAAVRGANLPKDELDHVQGLVIFLAESFANAAELLMTYVSRADPVGSYFLGRNTINPSRHSVPLESMHRFFEKFGARELGGLVLMSRLIGHFGFSFPTDEHGQSILRFLGAGVTAASQDSDFVEIFEAMLLPQKKLQVTYTKRMIEVLGFGHQFEKLRSGCPFEHLQASPAVAEVARNLVSCLADAL